MEWNLVSAPDMSRALARVKNHPTVRAMPYGWWDRFLEEAERVSAIDDLSAEFRDVIKPLMEQ